MKNIKSRQIVLFGIVLLISILISIYIINMKTQRAGDQNEATDSTEFVWIDQFGKTNSNLSEEDKDKMYIETTTAALEKSILDGVGQLNGVSIEIKKTTEMTEVNIKLDMDQGLIIDKKDMDSIFNLVQKSVDGLSKDNITIVDQYGNELKN